MWRNIFRFAWRNIWRNGRRTGLTLLALVIGMIAVVFGRGYIDAIMQGMIQPILRMQTGHVRLVHRDFLRMERIMPKDRLVAPLERIETLLRETEGVEEIIPVIRFRALAAHGRENENCLVYGVSAAGLRQTMQLDRHIESGSYFSEAGDEVIVGDKLARNLGLEVGDELLLVATDSNYSTYALPFRVIGFFNMGYYYLEKNALFISYRKAEEMMDFQDAGQEILVFISRPEQAPRVAVEIQSGISGFADEEIQVIPWQQSAVIADSVPMLRQIWGSIFYLVMFIVGLVILNTMLMTVMERYHEIGILKALGFKKREVIALIFCEAVFIGLIGSLSGALCGALLTGWVGKTGIDLSQAFNPEMFESLEIPFPVFGSTLHPELSLGAVLIALALGVAATLLAVIYPAWKSARMSPVEAFRSDLKV